MSLFECWFDGATEPVNPGGHGAWGGVIHRDGEKLWSGSGYVGVGPHISNNCSEYAAITAVLERLGDAPGSVMIYGDSMLVVNQLNGTWRVKGGLYTPFYEKAKELFIRQKELRNRNLSLRWIPREENAEADDLSKEVLMKMGVDIHVRDWMAK